MHSLELSPLSWETWSTWVSRNNYFCFALLDKFLQLYISHLQTVHAFRISCSCRYAHLWNTSHGNGKHEQFAWVEKLCIIAAMVFVREQFFSKLCSYLPKVIFMFTGLLSQVHCPQKLGTWVALVNGKGYQLDCLDVQRTMTLWHFFCLHFIVRASGVKWCLKISVMPLLFQMLFSSRDTLRWKHQLF